LNLAGRNVTRTSYGSSGGASHTRPSPSTIVAVGVYADRNFTAIGRFGIGSEVFSSTP